MTKKKHREEKPKDLDSTLTLRDKELFTRKRKQLNKLESENDKLIEEVNGWKAKFDAKLRELNEPLQEQIKSNLERVNKALNKKTEDQQKRLVELNGAPGNPGLLQKLRKEVQELWIKVEGLTEVDDEDEAPEEPQADESDVDDLIAEVEKENGT